MSGEQRRSGEGSASRPSPRDVEAYLREHIPLSRALGAKVTRFDGRELRLSAPLAPNLNHRSTAFGGSLSALAILAGWARVAFDLRAGGSDARVVVQRATLDFVAPADADFEVRVPASDDEAWEAFLRTLRRRGKARLRVHGTLHAGDDRVAGFEASYVAMLPDR